MIQFNRLHRLPLIYNPYIIQANGKLLFTAELKPPYEIEVQYESALYYC